MSDIAVAILAVLAVVAALAYHRYTVLRDQGELDETDAQDNARPLGNVDTL